MQNGYGIGQVARFGERSLFISQIRAGSVTVRRAGMFGGAGETVGADSPLDLGDGCTVTLERVENGRAFLSGEGCAGAEAAPADTGTQNETQGELPAGVLQLQSGAR